MNNKSLMTKYMKPSGGARVMCWALFLLTVALIVSGIILPKLDNRDKALHFEPGAESAVPDEWECVYADIVAVSDWVYKYNDSTTYAALGENGCVYALNLSKEQFEAMKAQNDYWNSTEDEPEQPESFRVYGHCYELKSETAEAVAAVWGMKNASEYYDYFGDRYINCTYSPYIEVRDILWVIAIFTGLAWGMTALVVFSKSVSFKRCMRKLEATGLADEAAEDFAAAQTIDQKDKLRFGEKYIFYKEYGAIIPYSNVLWCYRKSSDTDVSIELRTITEQLYTVCSIGKSIENVDTEQEEKIYDLLKKGNPKILFGYTTENAMLYKYTVEEYKEILKK